ncbi:RCC1 domain-containing protein [Streptomyces clavuligerus]|uniref:RCC1 domain-containing protein n=1 Tax=Streptomyces clavuligerus TaxID=1901 RepID=UPI0018D08249|nr:RCC1 domain-containing protein [Streptomyces clavuligerus]
MRIRSFRTAGMAAATAVLTAATTLAATSAPARALAPEPWVEAWGTNGSGQLGNGSTVAQQTPAPVLALVRDGIRELAGGGGEVATGDGVQVDGPSLGRPFAVALMENGTVQAWGGNDKGQLGNGTTTDQGFPAMVAGLSGISEIAAGGDHALAVHGGRVMSWGGNGKGQLAAGAATDPTKTPVVVQSLTRVKDVGAGCAFSVALGQDGTLWSWGAGAKGQLGLGAANLTDHNTPQQVKGVSDIAAIAVGCEHVLALTSTGKVKAWGGNTNGQLGNNTTTDSGEPVDVQFVDAVTSLYATAYGSFATLSDGTVWAWGANTKGQLGDGTLLNRTTPVPIETLSGAVHIAGGSDHTVAARDNGSVTAWGDNAKGQLGDGTTTSAPKPGTVTTLPPGSGVLKVATTMGTSSFAY